MEEHGDDDETMERSDNVEAAGEQEFPAITWNQSLWFLNFGICFLSFPSRSQLLGIRYTFPAHHCVQGVEVWAIQSMGGKWVQDVYSKWGHAHAQTSWENTQVCVGRVPKPLRWVKARSRVGGRIANRPTIWFSVHRCRTSYQGDQLLHKWSFACYHHHQTEKWCINKPWLRPSSWIVVKAGFEEHQGSLFQITGHCGLLLLRKGLCDYYLLYNWIHLLDHRSLSAFPDKCDYDLKSGIFYFRCACSS